MRDLEQRVGPHAYARHDIHLHRETYDRDRKRITEQLANHQPKEIAGVKVARVRSDDGFKFYLEDGSWVLFRTSGTEPLVRIYSEAADAAAVEARLQAIEEIVGLKAEAARPCADLPAVQRAEETLVEKPWGYEIRWAITERYLGKILHVRKGEALSLQYHELKDEWLSGHARHRRHGARSRGRAAEDASHARGRFGAPHAADAAPHHRRSRTPTSTRSRRPRSRTSCVSKIGTAGPEPSPQARLAQPMKTPPGHREAPPVRVVAVVEGERDRRFLIFGGVVLVAIALGFKSEHLGREPGLGAWALG